MAGKSFVWKIMHESIPRGGYTSRDRNRTASLPLTTVTIRKPDR